MSRDFALLLDHLRNKTGEVELAVPAPQGNGDAATAARLALRVPGDQQAVH